MVKEKMPSFIATHLDPANRFIEVVCGLIMVLTFTLVGSQLVSDDPSGAQKLLIAALGCNVAWGVIDGVMFVMNGLTAGSSSPVCRGGQGCYGRSGGAIGDRTGPRPRA